MLSLVGGVLAGLARLGWTVPPIASASAGNHAALMISAFFGTVISLERAVALGRRWAYLAPAAAAAAGLALLAAAPRGVAEAWAAVAAIIMVAANIQVVRCLFAPFTLVLLISALCWLIGNLTWAASGTEYPAVPWWLSFLILTIAGERLELTRVLPTPRVAQHGFHLIVGLVVTGAALNRWQSELGLAVFSAGLLALAL